MPLLTNALLLAPSTWTDLGPGPLTVSAHGPEWAGVILAVSDAQPPPTLLDGEPLRGTRFFAATTHVWALATGQPARVVVTAPDAGAGGGAATLADGADATQGTVGDAAWGGTGSGTLVAILKALWGRLGSLLAVQDQPFQPIRGQSVALTVGPGATAAPVALAAATATSYRVRNAATSASAATWILSAKTTDVPTIPTPYAATGAGGSPGDKTIDPGGVETVGLSAAQQTALAAGTLYFSAVCPPGGSAVLTVTPGNGG